MFNYSGMKIYSPDICGIARSLEYYTCRADVCSW